MLKMEAMPYEVLTSNEWSVKVLFAEKELELIEGVSLNDIATFNPDRLDKKLLEADVIYQYIDLNCISSEKGLINKSKEIKGGDLPARAMLKVREGDLLLSTVRPDQNNVAIVTKDFENSIINNTFVVIRPVNIKSELLYFLLRSEEMKYFLDAKAKGSAIPTLKIKDIKNLKIPIQENKKTNLKKAENLFECWVQHNQSIKTLKDITGDKFIKHHIVSNTKEDKKPKLYQVIPYKNLEDRLDVMYYYTQESSLEWLVPIYFMSEVIETIKSGVAISSKEYKKEGLPYVRIKDMQEGVISNKELIFIDDRFNKEHKKNLVKNGDVLISRVGTIGKAALVSAKYEGALANQHVSIISVNKEIIIPEYLVLYLNTGWAKKQLEQRAKGTGQKFINAKSIIEIDVPLPSLEKQNNIVIDTQDQIAKMDSSKLIQEINEFVKQLFN